MDLKLNLQNEVETCVALSAAASALLAEVIDQGGALELTEHAHRVSSLLHERLGQAKEMADRVVLTSLND